MFTNFCGSFFLNAEEDYMHFTKYKCHPILNFERGGGGPLEKIQFIEQPKFLYF
jgi:hypothetical protein